MHDLTKTAASIAFTEKINPFPNRIGFTNTTRKKSSNSNKNTENNLWISMKKQNLFY